MMKTKWIAIWLCILLALLPLGALGAARMPEQRGVVTDDANVLSTQTVTDLTTYFERVKEKTGIQPQLVVVHFLDGMDAQSYADELFQKWKLNADKDLLLLCAAGEDAVATSMKGSVLKTIGRANADNLMFTSSQFAALVRMQQYDAAVASWCEALNALLGKELNTKVRIDGLFGQTTVREKPVQSYGSELWNEVMKAISDSSVDYREYHSERQREENGLTAGGWIVLVILILIVCRQDKASRRYNRRSNRRQRDRHGCLGGLLGIVGVHALMDLLRGKR